MVYVGMETDTAEERGKPTVRVAVDGEQRFEDVAEPGYLARFDVEETPVEIEVDYD